MNDTNDFDPSFGNFGSDYSSSDAGTGDATPTSSNVTAAQFIGYGLAIVIGGAIAFTLAAALLPATAIVLAGAAVAGAAIGASSYLAYQNHSSFTDGVNTLFNGLQNATDSTEKALAVLPWILIAAVGVYSYNKAKS